MIHLSIMNYSSTYSRSAGTKFIIYDWIHRQTGAVLHLDGGMMLYSNIPWGNTGTNLPLFAVSTTHVRMGVRMRRAT